MTISLHRRLTMTMTLNFIFAQQFIFKRTRTHNTKKNNWLSREAIMIMVNLQLDLNVIWRFMRNLMRMCHSLSVQFRNNWLLKWVFMIWLESHDSIGLWIQLDWLNSWNMYLHLLFNDIGVVDGDVNVKSWNYNFSFKSGAFDKFITLGLGIGWKKKTS